MFIIVDSGSTKADWVVIRENEQPSFYTSQGLNPATHSSLSVELDNELKSHIQHANKIYFYGAGVIGAKYTQTIKSWLITLGNTGDQYIAEDMIGAARACFGNEPGVVCILGTGSNSCVYDGQVITASIPTLGYVFSDEGGGTHIGKEIIKQYFYNTMPLEERSVFDKKYCLTKGDVIENVYKSPHGNRFVASFVEFLRDIDSPWKEDLLTKVFTEFITLRVISYPNYKAYPIGIVGSIAHHYESELRKTFNKFGLKISLIIQKPIYNLIDYHKMNNI